MIDRFDPVDADDSFHAAPVRLSVDLQALADNWRAMARLSGKARTAAVVKADAYGIGIEDAGQTLYHAGVRDFFVALPQEGASLRPYAPQARIFVLSGIWDGVEDFFFEHDLVPVIASEEQLAFWMRVLAEQGEHPCALQIDTGFNRLGLSVEDALFLADDVSRPASFSPVLIMSHLIAADEPNHPLNRQQLQAFQQVTAAFEGIESSLSASAGILLGEEYHFDLTRPGIALYGASPFGAAPEAEALARKLPRQPVVKAEARILQVRDAKAGETVSYGASHVLTRDSRLAIAAIGYADGYLRNLSGHGVALRQTVKEGAFGFLAGEKLPVLGRITMDMTIFDVTDLAPDQARPGDYIELFGPHIAVDRVAEAAGTISYEMLTSLGLRYERHYIPAE